LNKKTKNDTGTPEDFRSGFVALVGRPNVGKSTLLNKMVGEIVAIATNRPQTTRTRIRGIVNRPNCQIVFLDTPGIHLAPAARSKPSAIAKKDRAINKYMRSEAQAALGEVDLTVLLVEAQGRGRQPEQDLEDRLVMDSIRKVKCPNLLAINKIDLLKNKEMILPVIQAYQQTELFEEMIPISAKNGDGVEQLLTAIDSRLTAGPQYFPLDMITDQPERILTAEFIREQVIRHTNQEIPFATAVEVISFEDVEGRDLVRIHAVIYIERKSPKGILIGKGGQKLKTIGSLARKSIEDMLACQVFLDLRVKVKADWSKTQRGMRSVGFEQK